MDRQTKIALRNFDELVRSRGLDEVSIDWFSESVIYGDGGIHLDVLLEEDFGSEDVEPTTRD